MFEKFTLFYRGLKTVNYFCKKVQSKMFDSVPNPANKYLPNLSDRNARIKCEIYSKLTLNNNNTRTTFVSFLCLHMFSHVFLVFLLLF